VRKQGVETSNCRQTGLFIVNQLAKTHNVVTNTSKTSQDDGGDSTGVTVELIALEVVGILPIMAIKVCSYVSSPRRWPKNSFSFLEKSIDQSIMKM
jgi:hypothetical protein